MMIDGATTDINQSRGFSNGFFSSNVDVTAWDSLAGHESGLLKLTELFNKGRVKTNENKITIPYRNGILHGKELNYDNKIVAAKLWALLFAVRDWGVSLRKKPLEERKTSNKSIFEILANHHEFKKFAADWKPREVLIDFNFDTTEDTVELEIEYLKKKNYLKLYFRWYYLDENDVSMALGQKGGTCRC
ncbi:unnamed protein product [Rotaria sp. Silwood1]|nr:unnamed protein product [Rotaria sp. Silwood1]CAF4591339.1 unnamed protein product [Rotaria sp. Silwood1]